MGLVCLELCNYHHRLILEHFHHTKRKLTPLAVTPHSPPCPHPLAATNLPSVYRFAYSGRFV